VPISFLVETVLLSIVAVGATLFCLVHDVNTPVPVVAISNAAAMIEFFHDRIFLDCCY
jgi:hypothetical protein